MRDFFLNNVLSSVHQHTQPLHSSLLVNLSMDSWYLILLFAVFIFPAAVFFFTAAAPRRRLPPGPRGLPFIGNPSLLGKPLAKIGPIIHRLRTIYGPIITLHIGGRPFIFIAGHAAAHSALVGAGAVFADRPAHAIPRSISITSAHYGPAWRVLRRNLAAEVLHPARVKSYSQARTWALGLVRDKLAAESARIGAVRVGDIIQFAMFSLFLSICFGEQMEEKQVREIETIQREVLVRVVQFNIFSFLPKFTKILLWKKLRENQSIRKIHEELFLPLIRARAKIDQGSSYVDSLLRLELPEKDGSRNLTELELVTLCSEFLNAGIDTTTATLQWAMAHLVKHPKIQKKLACEIESVVEQKGNRILEEDDLSKMQYLRAVLMETLRLHPPVHFVLPHAVVEEAELDGYVIPKNAIVNFAVAEMGRDGEVWKEPMEFRPERFLEQEVDLTGSKEIKMMPFGAGRRICPGIGLGFLHLEWFVANLAHDFEWKVKDGEEVDLAEEAEAAVVMKKPLEAVIVARKKQPSN